MYVELGGVAGGTTSSLKALKKVSDGAKLH